MPEKRTEQPEKDVIVESRKSTVYEVVNFDADEQSTLLQNMMEVNGFPKFRQMVIEAIGALCKRTKGRAWESDGLSLELDDDLKQLIADCPAEAARYVEMAFEARGEMDDGEV